MYILQTVLTIQICLGLDRPYVTSTRHITFIFALVRQNCRHHDRALTSAIHAIWIVYIIQIMWWGAISTPSGHST
jgi:hypothetical protein